MIAHRVTRGFGNGTFAGSIKCVVTRGFSCAEAAAGAGTIQSVRQYALRLCRNILTRKQV
jgi:hypothetical protein